MRFRCALISLHPAGSLSALTKAQISLGSIAPCWSCSMAISWSTIALLSWTLVTPKNGSVTLNVGFSALYIFVVHLCYSLI